MAPHVKGRGKLARARIDVTFANAEAIVTPSKGLFSSVRQALSTSAAGLLWSLELVIIGLCFVVVYIAEWADRKWYWASRLETWKIDRRHRAGVRLYRELTKKKKKEPSIWKLIGEYMLAAHDRVQLALAR